MQPLKRNGLSHEFDMSCSDSSFACFLTGRKATTRP